MMLSQEGAWINTLLRLIDVREILSSIPQCPRKDHISYLGNFGKSSSLSQTVWGYVSSQQKHFHPFFRTAQVKPSSLSLSRQGCLKSPDAEPKVLVLQMDQVLYS